MLDFESSNYNACVSAFLQPAPGVQLTRSSPVDSRVFLALALFNLGKPEESEETYKKAIEQSPTQALARQVRHFACSCLTLPSPLTDGSYCSQGLATLYEKSQRWTDYARELQGLMQLFADRCVTRFGFRASS